jgi:hypothetical protein
MMNRLVVLATVFALVSLWILATGVLRSSDAEWHPDGPTFEISGTAGAWFRRAKPFCNSVEADTWLRKNPPPQSLEGLGYAAACRALAGDIDGARAHLLRVDTDDRWKAAGIVFGVGHPVADAGDDRSAGPIMELVLEFWPNHYMALYHAGASNYQLGRTEAARRYLRDFLGLYTADDGWRRNAVQMLSTIKD